jgi:hypothetical protein
LPLLPWATEFPFDTSSSSKRSTPPALPNTIEGLDPRSAASTLALRKSG